MLQRIDFFSLTPTHDSRSFSSTGLRIRIANLLFKLITCVLYIFRVVTDWDPMSSAW